MKKFTIVSDIHGCLMDERACAAAIAFTKDFKPDIRIIAGDLWDFAAIRKGASQDEQSQSMREDFVRGADFADDFFSGGVENVLMKGNHDVRVDHLAESADAVKADLGKKMVEDIAYVARRNNAMLLPYDSRLGVYHLGHLKVIHGFHTGVSACATHARIYGNVVFGHTHSIESFQTPGLEQKEARSIGCCCDLNPRYANAKTGKLRWAHGWAMGFVYDDGTYSLYQIRGVNGNFHAPANFHSY